MQKTFSSISALERELNNVDLSANIKRIKALENYFSAGGIIRINVSDNQQGWPKLVYPTKLRLQHQIKEKQALRDNLSKKLSVWQKKLNEAKNYHKTHNIKKLTSPIYWKHKAKTMTDPEYKKDAEKVKLPVHLVSDPKWTPMIKTFLTDYDYRKQLTETVETSIVYKKDKRVAKYADSLQSFRIEESEKHIEDLSKKVNDLNTSISSLEAILAWA